MQSVSGLVDEKIRLTCGHTKNLHHSQSMTALKSVHYDIFWQIQVHLKMAVRDLKLVHLTKRSINKSKLNRQKNHQIY